MISIHLLQQESDLPFEDEFTRYPAQITAGILTVTTSL